MALAIETFNNAAGGSSFFKAIGHPYIAPALTQAIDELEAAGEIAIVDPRGYAEAFLALHPVDPRKIAGVYAQNIDKIGMKVAGQLSLPLTKLSQSSARGILVLAFDAQRLLDQLRAYLPAGAKVVTLDVARLPQDWLSDPVTYLNPLNFATNFAFFRDQDGEHTRVVSANYWSGYGATAPRMWLRLFDGDGVPVRDWFEDLPPANGTVIIDSAAIRARFELPDFCGQLFIHVLGAKGHDIVKYALDTYGDDVISASATHDANAWPADFYAGLPAPDTDETVILWVQNSHPVAIPAGSIGLNPMGEDDEAAWLPVAVAPFATCAVDVASLLPDLRWPGQIEIRAGKHFVRPRYEVVRRVGNRVRRRIAHANVERVDLISDPKLPDLSGLMGKGFILPAPILPTSRFATAIQPTPMARSQHSLPIAALVYDASGREVARHAFGNLARSHQVAVDLDRLVDGLAVGHVELIYDFAAGQEADGWLHALFRYRDRETGHEAETSFGAHMFNTVLTYRGEPQSYAGPPPGLSTRLFLRVGGAGYETICHLIYPASTAWRATSATSLVLVNAQGQEVCRREIAIPCSGSAHIVVSEQFTPAELTAAGAHAYVLIRDTTCRLFGYHGLRRHGQGGAFSLDHMFGF